MITRLRSRLARDGGTVLPLVAASMIVLLGAVAFAVDLGWIYLNGARQQRAADASALAAVTALPTDANEWAASTAYQTAKDMGLTNGYQPSEIAPFEVFGPDGVKLPNRIRVDVTRDVDTFFMRLFGIDSINLTKTATAEFVPPLQLGSDQPVLGNFPDDKPLCEGVTPPIPPPPGQPPPPPDPSPGNCLDPYDPDTWGGNQPGFWMAINAQYTAKEQGDPYMTRCNASGSPSSCISPNDEFSSAGYYYAVEVPAGAGSLAVDVFDGRYWGGFGTSEWAAGDVMWFFDAGPTTTFRLYAPDDTPNNPSDNTEVLCSQTYPPDNSGPEWGGDPGAFSVDTICSRFTGPGVYVLQVTAGGGHAVNGFAVRARTSGAAAKVYGVGRMSLKANQAGSNPEFQLVKVTDVYAGQRLVVSLFDPGEAQGAAWVSFRGGAAGLDCEVEIRRNNGLVEGPMSPAALPGGPPPGGGAACYAQTAPDFGGSDVSEYNGDWLDFYFDVPADYSCSGQGCWWLVRYTFSGEEVNDRTTWRAAVAGQPVRLVLGD